MLADKYPYNIGPLWNNEYEAVRLKDVAVADLISKKLCDPYVMGYVPTEKYPGNFFLNVTELSSNQRTITFTNILSQKNIGWGFAMVGSYSSGKPNLLAITNSNTLYNSSSSPNNDCILVINKVQMAKMCARATRINCTLVGLIMPVDDEPADDAVFFSNYDSRWKSTTLNINISDYKAMMESVGTENPTRFRFKINFDGADRYFNICDDDFNDYNIAKLHDENNGYTLYCTIKYFSVNEERTYYGYNNTSVEVRNTPFFRIPLTEDNTQGLNTDICACFMPFYGYANDWRVYYYTNTDTLAIGSTSSAWRIAGYDIGNYPYSIDLDELQSISSFNYNRDGIVYGKYLLNQKGYGDNYWGFQFFTQNRLSDGWKQYALYHKSFVDGESYSSSDYPRYNGKFEVSLFDENDVPLLTREPTLSSYPELYDKLRPWQKLDADITANEFDPADIPEWVPPSPGDDDAAFSGDEFAPVVNYRVGTAAGFITLYALTDNQLAALGAALWATPLTDAFWESIGVMATTDFSVDPAHILDYIVSIRKYPLNIANLNIFHTGTPGIYLGRGINGLSVGGNVGYLDSYSCDVYGGSVSVPTEFGDFRDYEPYTKVSLYVPFCGTVELTPSQVVGRDVMVQYVIDFSNGVIQANVIVGGTGIGLVTLAVLSGKIGADVQATADNQIGQLQKISSIGHSVASTGIKIVAAAEGYGEGTKTLPYAMDSTAAASVSGQNSIMGTLMSSVMSHNLGSNEGFSSFSMLTPCIFVERKHYIVPPNYGHTHGYACNITTTLGALEGKGFTVCGNVDLTGVPATQDELAALEALLQSGVYL